MRQTPIALISFFWKSILPKSARVFDRGDLVIEGVTTVCGRGGSEDSLGEPCPARLTNGSNVLSGIILFTVLEVGEGEIIVLKESVGKGCSIVVGSVLSNPGNPPICGIVLVDELLALEDPALILLLRLRLRSTDEDG